VCLASRHLRVGTWHDVARRPWDLVSSSSSSLMSDTTAPNGMTLPELCSVDEIAHWLRVDRKTVYAMVRRRRLPGARRFGRVIRVHRDTFLASFQGAA
jgi:excisionase family DNA binding protein